MVGILLTMLAIGLFAAHQYYPSLLIFFALATYGYFVIPPELLLIGSPFDKTTDLALLYTLAILLYRLTTTVTIAKNEAVFRIILVYLGFTLIDAIYSYQTLGYDLTGVVRVFRSNVIFLSFGVLAMVPTSELLRIWHTLAIITVLQCLLYLLQLPTGTVLLGASYNVTINNMTNIGWIRYYNTPPFLIPALFYYLFGHRCQSKLLQWCIIGVLAITVVAPMHRSYILVVVLVISTYVLTQQSFSRRLVYLCLLLLAVNGALMFSPIRARLDTGLADLGNTFAPGRSLADKDYSVEDTFGYRMAHLFERIDYVLKEPMRFVFGVGMLAEDTKQAAKLPFEAGLYNERLGRQSQVDTGDIAWSMFILYLGVVGTALLIRMFVKFFQFFYQHRSIPLSVIGLLMLSSSLLLSFTGTEIVMIPFRALLVLLLATVIKQAKTSQHTESNHATINPVTIPPVQEKMVLPTTVHL